MKKYMKVIFIIAVLFIISVGLFGVLRGNHKQNKNVSYNNLLSNEEKEKNDDTQEAQSQTEESAKVSETTAAENAVEDTQDATESAEMKQSRLNTQNEPSDEDKSEKEQYIARLDSIKDYYDDMWKKSESDMTSMKELQNQEYTKWDDELNTIYQLIKKKLPEEEFVKIRDEERQWIKDRDDKSELAASKYAGGTMEGLEYMAVMTDLTRERTYELVVIYFKE